MKPLSTQLVRGIAGVLENDVLPELGPTTWAASQVRSCLAVLAHLERRVDHERGFLLSDNEALRSLFEAAQDRLQKANAGQALGRRIGAVLSEQEGGGPDHDLDGLTRRNEAYKTLLNELIEWLHGPNAGLPREAGDAMVQQVRDYLNKSSVEEFVMFERSTGMSPL